MKLPTFLGLLCAIMSILLFHFDKMNIIDLVISINLSMDYTIICKLQDFLDEEGEHK